MAKIDPNKTIQKRRTEEEMRAALQAFIEKDQQRSMPPQDDDEDVVLHDVIEELLEARQHIEEIRAFSQAWQMKIAVKR